MAAGDLLGKRPMPSRPTSASPSRGAKDVAADGSASAVAAPTQKENTSSGGPSSRGVEEIRVSAKVFREHKGDVNVLRQLQLQEPPDSQPELIEKTLSYRSAFKLKCQLSDTPLRNPWQGIENPEETRQFDEKDLILNQVMPRTPKEAVEQQLMARTPQGSSRHTPTTDSRPPDLGGSGGRSSTKRFPRPHSGCRTTESRAAGAQVGSSLSARVRSSSLRAPRVNGHGSQLQLPTASHRGSSCARRSSSARRPESESSGSRPPVPRDVPSPTQPKTAPNRIRLVEDSDDDEPREESALRMKYKLAGAKHFSAPIPSKGPHAVWISVDPRTGDLCVYPRPVSLRLEAGYWEHKLVVDFKGLGTYLEDSFVELSSGRPVQVNPSNRGRREVRRVEVTACSDHVTADVIKGRQGFWRFAREVTMGSVEGSSAASPGSGPPAQARRAQLTETDIIPKGSAATAPAARRQPLHFINDAAF